MCLHHLRIGEQQEGMTIPLDSYMVNVIMGCEEVRDLDLGGPVHILQGVQMPDVMAAPQCLLFTRPCCLYRHELWED